MILSFAIFIINVKHNVLIYKGVASLYREVGFVSKYLNNLRLEMKKLENTVNASTMKKHR